MHGISSKAGSNTALNLGIRCGGIGCNSWFQDDAELRVEGTLSTADSVDLKNTDDGFISLTTEKFPQQWYVFWGGIQRAP